MENLSKTLALCTKAKGISSEIVGITEADLFTPALA